MGPGWRLRRFADQIPLARSAGARDDTGAARTPPAPCRPGTAGTPAGAAAPRRSTRCTPPRRPPSARPRWSSLSTLRWARRTGGSRRFCASSVRFTSPSCFSREPGARPAGVDELAVHEVGELQRAEAAARALRRGEADDDEIVGQAEPTLSHRRRAARLVGRARLLGDDPLEVEPRPPPGRAPRPPRRRAPGTGAAPTDGRTRRRIALRALERKRSEVEVLEAQEVEGVVGDGSAHRGVADVDRPAQPGRGSGAAESSGVPGRRAPRLPRRGSDGRTAAPRPRARSRGSSRRSRCRCA